MKHKIMISLFAFLLIGNTGSHASDSDNQDFVRDGVHLHDQGRYKEATEKFLAALQKEPANVEALYELSNTYAALEKYDLAISTAEKGLKFSSDLRGQLFAMVGSCFSSQGKPEEALRVFRKGLEEYPNDISLNFNIAVTLANRQENSEAIAHLKNVVETQPSYPSPYYLLGELYHREGYRVPSIYFFMRYIMLDPNSQRAGSASRTVFELLNLGITQQSSGDVTVAFDSNKPKDEGDFSTLELALSLAAASTHTDKEQKKPQCERAVDALVSFVQISLDMTDENLSRTFTWKWAARQVIDLQQQGLFKTFGYVLASRAGIEGSTDWLQQNPGDLAKLNNALSVTSNSK